MPIRINLLAEDQALEEERRRDPVKRAYLAAGLIIAAVLAWTSLLQMKVMNRRAQFNGLQAQWTGLAEDYTRAVDQQRKVIEAEQHIAALHTLTTNRFLWGTALNALQAAMVGVDHIQVTRLSCVQTYRTSDEVKTTTRNGIEIPGKPAQATETISMKIRATDASPQPGSAVDKFKKSLGKIPYFAANLRKTNGVMLTSLSPPQTAAGGRQPFVTFSVQCDFPEKVR
ncbi:MAG: hypothetical protein JXQ71_04480 [Verrucomicrobia bacterium]|nr:hypothetical protein [Verrucomicrobiota bacterium]